MPNPLLAAADDGGGKDWSRSMIIAQTASQGNSAARPRRYLHDPELSAVVDLLQNIEDRLFADGDYANATLAAKARHRAVDIALGARSAVRR